MNPKILIVLVTLCATKAYAETDKNTACSVTNAYFKQENIHSETLKVIEMGDRKIYTLFTPHLRFEHKIIYDAFIALLVEKKSRYEEAADEIEAAKEKKLYEEMIEEMRVRKELFMHWLVEKFSPTIVSERNDVQIITKLFNSDHTIQWIGIEVAENEHPAPTQLYKEAGVSFYLETKNNLKDFLTQDEIEDVLHLTSENYIIAIAENPELFREVELVFLDDNSKKNSEIIWNKKEELLEEIHRKMSPEDAMRIALIDTIAIINAKKIPLSAITAELKKDKESMSLKSAYFAYTNHFIEEAIFKRDQTMASIALKQSGNGLIILGSAHSIGVTERLLSACRSKLIEIR